MHLPDLEYLETFKVINTVVGKMKIGNIRIGAKRIYDEVVSQNFKNIAIRSYNKIKSTIYRRAKSWIPSEPAKFDDVNFDLRCFFIDDSDDSECTVKYSSKEFIIFSLVDLLELFERENTHLFFDGTLFNEFI